MAKKNNNKGRGSKRTAPPQFIQRQPIPRPRVSFDGTILRGFETSPAMISVANSHSSIVFVDCGSINATVGSKRQISLGEALAGITAKYQQYRFLNLMLHWIPHVAPGVADAGSPVYVSYVDSPEVISGLTTTTAIQDITGAKSFRSLRTFNVWQGFSMKVPLTRRLPWFNTNLTSAYTVDIVERATQGALIVGVETLSAAVDVGALHFTYDIEVRGLQTGFTV